MFIEKLELTQCLRAFPVDLGGELLEGEGLDSGGEGGVYCGMSAMRPPPVVRMTRFMATKRRS